MSLRAGTVRTHIRNETVNMFGKSVPVSGGVESLLEASASIIGRLNSMTHADTPTKPMALTSDCCGSNNYPEEQPR